MGFFDNCDQAFIDAMDQQYDQAAIKGKYVEIPEGEYQAYVQSFMLRESKKNAGEFGLSIGLKIVGGPYDGCTLSKYIPLSMDSMDRLKSDLTVLRFRYDGVTSLDDEERMREMLDLLLDIRVTRKKGRNVDQIYTNIWLNRNHGYYEHPDELAGEENYYGGATPPWGQR